MRGCAGLPSSTAPAGHIGYDAGLCADLRTLANVQVSRHCRLASDLTKSSSTVEPAIPTWAHNNAAASQPDIVSDLNQVIET